MNYFIEITSVNQAKNDVDRIVASLGYHSLTRSQGGGKAARFFTKLAGVARIATTLKRGDTLFLQYPLKKFYKLACILARLKGARVVTLVHDLGAFRRHKLTPGQENRRLSQTDFLIVHNAAMKQWLLQHGCRMPLYELGIFDYLSDSKPARYDTPHHPWRVVYAGGLGRWRNNFLYDIDPYIDRWELHIYGKGLDGQAAQGWKHIAYHGFVDSETFVGTAEADFGLVWDGDSLDECTGPWGVYLKINNPHKTSFYLRAGIPVLVWSQSAMAPFIAEHGLGIAIDSLKDIGRVLNGLTPDRYAALKANATALSGKLGDGYFIKQALRAAQLTLDPPPQKPQEPARP